jgi:catechol 2,3-dioxygenase-like lactoylglutathione lyase family enzyme
MDIQPHDMRLHHVGVITKNLADSRDFYTSLGYAASAIYVDPVQKARIVRQVDTEDCGRALSYLLRGG